MTTTGELVKGPPMKTISVNLPENAIIFVPDGSPKRTPKPGEYRHIQLKDFYLTGDNWGTQPCHVIPRYTPSEYAELSKPKLPAVGSVWRVEKNDQTYMVADVASHGEQHGIRLLSAAEFPSSGLMLAADFAAWVRDNDAVCVYDPSKEQAP